MAVTTMIGAKIHRREDPRLITGHGRFVDDIDDLGGVEAERNGEQQVGLSNSSRHVRRQTATGIEKDTALAEHRQDVSQEIGHRGRAELTKQVNDLRLFQQCHGLLEIRFRDLGEQILKRGDIADDQILKKPAFAAVFARAKFAFQRLDPRFEAGRRRGEALLEQTLKCLEAIIAESLGEPDNVGRVNPATPRDRVDRVHGHIVGILGQINRDPLIRLTHVIITLMNSAD